MDSCFVAIEEDGSHCKMFHQHPIVGVVCVDVSHKLSTNWPDTTSYIAASYVKMMQDQGANCVPIWINKSEDYYRGILNKINGVLIPGGAVWYDSKDNSKERKDTNYCVETVNMILRLVCEMSDRNINVPVWGICLGFQLMINYTAGEKDIREKRCQLNRSMPLELTEDIENSKMFRQLPKDMKDHLKKEPFAYHFHHFYITREILATFGIADQWTVTGVNQDDKGLEFITTIEHKKYPLYGVQFHPEKTLFEARSPNRSDTETSKNCAKYFAEFFVAECGKNSNRFEDENDLQRHIISKFSITDTVGTPWLQCYLFEKDFN